MDLHLQSSMVLKNLLLKWYVLILIITIVELLICIFILQTLYRPEEILVHSRLRHCNVINLEAVLVGEKHECYKDKCYVFCFMPKMAINFGSVLSFSGHGCLIYLKMHLAKRQWQMVLLNVKHILRSVLKALDYMHSQGYVHGGVECTYVTVTMNVHICILYMQPEYMPLANLWVLV